MADKHPVAVRITRPYDTEDEFLNGEIDTLTRTTVLLVGAQKRPEGVVLRFEITLRNGAALVRGEGRVVGYKEDAHMGEPGLLMRFTRLDSKSKALVDRASVRREAKRQSIRPPPPPPPPSPPPPPPPESEDRPSAVPEIQVTFEAPRPSSSNPPASASAESVALPSSPTLSIMTPSAPEGVPALRTPSRGQSREIAPPPDRDATLERLRNRAKTLRPEQVEAILKARGT